MEASILYQTHRGTINKSRFRSFSQINRLRNGRQKMRKIISTYKFFAPTRKDPNHDMIVLIEVNCVTCLFVKKRQVTQLTSVKKIISWFGSFRVGAKNLWVEIVLLICWRHV